MLRVSLASTGAAAALAVLLAGTAPATAADVHWFYDDHAIHDGQAAYLDDDAYAPPPPGYRRGRAPEPEYSLYRPAVPDEPGWRDRDRPAYGHRRALSCLEGAGLVREAGFSQVEVVDCRGRGFVYEALRGREPWRIRMSRASGDIVDAHPLD